MSSTADSTAREDLPPPPPLRGPSERVQHSAFQARPSLTPASSYDVPSTPRRLFVADHPASVSDSSPEPVGLAVDLSPDAATPEPKAQSGTPTRNPSTETIGCSDAESLPTKEEGSKKKGIKRKGTGTSKVYWNDKDTAVLLEIYGSHKYQKMFLGGKVSYKVIWTEIAREVKDQTGLAIDYRTCWDKQKYLKKKYKEAKKSVTSGSGGEVTLSCPHFDELDKLFSEDPTITPELEITELEKTEKKPYVPGPTKKKSKTKQSLQADLLEISRSTLKVFQETSSENAATNKALLTSLQTGNDILTALLSSVIPAPPPPYSSPVIGRPAPRYPAFSYNPAFSNPVGSQNQSAPQNQDQWINTIIDVNDDRNHATDDQETNILNLH